MILNPIRTTSANLIWQSPLDGGGSRRRKRVALLRSDDQDNVSFEYLTGTPEFQDARDEGFQGYTGIPLDRQDTSDAINTLGRRLPSPERSDYAEFLARYGLDAADNLPILSLLAYTGARLTSDSFSVSDTFEGFDRPFQYIFDVAGRRHHLEATPSPEIGDQVLFASEPDNPADPGAVALTDTNGNRFGYVNACQTEAVNRWLSEGEITGRVFRVNGRASYPRLFVMADITPSKLHQVA